MEVEVVFKFTVEVVCCSTMNVLSKCLPRKVYCRQRLVKTQH